MSSAPAPASTQAGTQAVDRAAALVDLVVRASEPLSFTELSDETGLARSTTSRLLAALEVVDRARPVSSLDRKSTRLNSSHMSISYAVFCLKKKKKHP